MFGIWIPSDDLNAWKNFKEHLPSGILEWEVEERTTSVNFLDLTISINKDSQNRHQNVTEGNEYLPLSPTNISAPTERHMRHDLRHA